MFPFCMQFFLRNLMLLSRHRDMIYTILIYAFIVKMCPRQ
jgi:hypothetical protein